MLLHSEECISKRSTKYDMRPSPHFLIELSMLLPWQVARQWVPGSSTPSLEASSVWYWHWWTPGGLLFGLPERKKRLQALQVCVKADRPRRKTLAKRYNSRSFTISKIFLWPSFHLVLPARSSSFLLRKLGPRGDLHLLCWRSSLWSSTRPSISALFWHTTGDCGLPRGLSCKEFTCLYRRRRFNS